MMQRGEQSFLPFWSRFGERLPDSLFWVTCLNLVLSIAVGYYHRQQQLRNR